MSDSATPGADQSDQADPFAAANMLETRILGATPKYGPEEVAARAGLELVQAQRLWRAFGFPEPEGSETAFTDNDVLALRRLLGTVEEGVVDLDTIVNLTRAVGQTMSRLADWQVSVMSEGDNSVTDLVESAAPDFESMLLYAWRRHLAAAVGRVAAVDAEHAENMTTNLTVGFVDIVAFTELSNSIDESRLGELVEIFETRTADVISSKRGRMIKAIGDSVLFVTENAVTGVEIAEGIIQVIGRDKRMPDVRLGLASGDVVTRLGDVFGPPVNLAARLTNVARRNRVVIDQETGDRLPHDVFEVRAMPARPLRGFGILEPLTVHRH